MVLFCQNLGRRHQGGLLPGLDRTQHGQQRDHRLAGANIALEQPQHPPVRRQVRVDLLEGARLGTSERVAKPLQCLGLKRATALQRAARTVPEASPDHGQRHLIGEQLVVGQPFTVLPIWGRRGRLHRPQGFDERGPLLPPQQSGVMPFGQRWHAGQCLCHGVGNLARP